MNRKGFTLVELLAVIVILSIIALIVTPVVNNIILSARMAANARSVEGHIRNVELVIMTKAFNEETGDLTVYDSEGSSLPTSIQASLPSNDDVVCSSYMIENGTVTMALGCISERENWKELYSYTNVTGAEIIREFKGTLVSAETTDTHKGIVYLDPSDLSVTCNSTSTITTTIEGCKKFYIYDDEGNTYKMIMDRNLGLAVQWVSLEDYLAAGGTEEEYGEKGNNSKGPITANKIVASRTTGWIGNPRLIREDEVRKITNKSTYASHYYFGSNDSYGYESQNAEEQARQQSYHWLFDYLTNCTEYGCEIAHTNAGTYWTSSALSIHNNLAHIVKAKGGLDNGYVYSFAGIRPVITLPKSLINS